MPQKRRRGCQLTRAKLVIGSIVNQCWVRSLSGGDGPLSLPTVSGSETSSHRPVDKRSSQRHRSLLPLPVVSFPNGEGGSNASPRLAIFTHQWRRGSHAVLEYRYRRPVGLYSAVGPDVVLTTSSHSRRGKHGRVRHRPSSRELTY